MRTQPPDKSCYPQQRSHYQLWGKRALDLTIASIALTLTAPLILIAALAIKIRMGSPLFFNQARVGLYETTFTIFKLRTMTNDCDESGQLLPDNERTSAIGKWIRRLSIDELPQLLNVIRGEMSLVGPRPLLVRYLPYYTSRERQRHNVLPGITGLAQINGRNATTWTRRLDLDSRYAEDVNFRGDINILWSTVRKVLISDGIESGAKVTMPFLDEERLIEQPTTTRNKDCQA